MSEPFPMPNAPCHMPHAPCSALWLWQLARIKGASEKKGLRENGKRGGEAKEAKAPSKRSKPKPKPKAKAKPTAEAEAEAGGSGDEGVRRP